MTSENLMLHVNFKNAQTNFQILMACNGTSKIGRWISRVEMFDVVDQSGFKTSKLGVTSRFVQN